MTTQELRENKIRELGYVSWFGSPKAYNELTGQQQENVTWAMQYYIAENPSSFDAGVVERARRWVAGESGPTQLLDPSISVSDFGSAFADEVVKKTTLGGGVLANALYLAAIVGAVWFFFFRLKK